MSHVDVEGSPVPTLLVVAHAPTASAAALCEAVLAGASDDALVGVDVVVGAALDTGAEAVEAAEGVVLVTPVNFGYISGGLKDFFDRTYPRLSGQRPRLPFAAVLKGNHDATGALRAVEQITTGLQWRPVVAPLVVLGDVTDDDLDAASELGATVAATLLVG